MLGGEVPFPPLLGLTRTGLSVVVEYVAIKVKLHYAYLINTKLLIVDLKINSHKDKYSQSLRECFFAFVKLSGVFFTEEKCPCINILFSYS